MAIYETGQTEDGVCFLVSEYIEGDTLEDRLQTGRLGPPRAARYAAVLAGALQYAHEHGIVHRDIKPSNVLIDCDDRPHLMDFGLAKQTAGESTITLDGQVMGTPAYMSPEQARGESHCVDARTDVYSLGVVLYEMLTGERPFLGRPEIVVLQVLEQEPKPPRKVVAAVPRDLEIICLKAMARSREHRYRSAGELADDLRRFLDGEPIKARPLGAAERLWRWCCRNPLAVSSLVAVSLGAAVGLLYQSSLQESFVQQTALESTRMQAEMFEETNAFYSELVERLEKRDVEITHEYLSQRGAMPLPATFTIDAGERISRSETGMQVRLYSDHPFPWRTDGGPRDEFEHNALRALRAKPDESFYEFTELNGRPVLRYAVARRMQHSCLKCHNTHPDSPKTDWQEGDVRGVLEIVRPLDRDIARTRSGSRGAVVVMGTIAALFLTISTLTLMGTRARRRPRG